QMRAHVLEEKLRERLGEGLFNGALTTRIGIAAIDVCRPLPYLETLRPRFRGLAPEVTGVRGGLAGELAAVERDLLRLAVIELERHGDLVGAGEPADTDAEARLLLRPRLLLTHGARRVA